MVMFSTDLNSHFRQTFELRECIICAGKSNINFISQNCKVKLQINLKIRKILSIFCILLYYAGRSDNQISNLISYNQFALPNTQMYTKLANVHIWIKCLNFETFMIIILLFATKLQSFAKGMHAWYAWCSFRL